MTSIDQQSIHDQPVGGAIAVAPPRRLPQMAAAWADLQAAAQEGVNEYTRLLPVPALQQILAEAEVHRPTASQEKAAELAALIVGSYPSHRTVGDPAIYARAITSLLMEHAPDVGAEAVEAITRTHRFLPSRAEVHAVLEQIEARRAAALYVARAMLREHERREQQRRATEERAKDAIDPAEWQALIGRLARATASGAADE